MLNKIIKNKNNIIELLIIFIITLIFNLFCTTMTLDEVWNYGFAYNISTGLTPYKDFNMVITPLYPMISGLFLTIFGRNIITFHILNAIICTRIFALMKQFIPKSYYMIYILIIFYSNPSYNIFLILLLYILIYLESKKYNDYLIGIMLGLTFITKQNIGVYLSIPTVFTKDIKKIFKRIIGFIIPILLLTIYLLLTNSINDFINYTVLGISSFAKDVLSFSTVPLIILLLSIIFLIYQYIKTKDLIIVYLICFQFIVFPLGDNYHIMIGLIPTIGYIINKLNINKKLIIAAFVITLTMVFSINIYTNSKGERMIPNATQEFKYRKLPYPEAIATVNIKDYINTIEEKLYIISRNAYAYKLEAKIPITKYDLLNDGNLGYNGASKLIKELEETCNINKCVFLVDKLDIGKEENLLYNQEIVSYIITNYQLIDVVQHTNLLIYKNF